MRRMLSTRGLLRDLEPMLGVRVRFRSFGVESPGCAPMGVVELRARSGVPVVRLSRPVRPMAPAATPAADLPSRPAEVIAAGFGTVASAADGSKAPVATGRGPAGGRP